MTQDEAITIAKPFVANEGYTWKSVVKGKQHKPFLGLLGRHSFSLIIAVEEGGSVYVHVDEKENRVDGFGQVPDK